MDVEIESTSEERGQANDRPAENHKKKLDKSVNLGATELTSKKSKNNRNKLLIICGLIGLILMIAIFGSPSADVVFKDMNKRMLQTKSLSMTQELELKDSERSSTIRLNAYMDMSSSDNIKIKGDFNVSVTSEGIPMEFVGDALVIGDQKFVRYSKISSTDDSVSDYFSSLEKKLKGHWIKVRDSDKNTIFATAALEATTTIFPTPYANLPDKELRDVLDIMLQKDSYTIEESSKVDLSGVPAYKYQLKYDKDRYKQFAKIIANYSKYFSESESDGKNGVTKLTIWVDIANKRVVKMEYEGTVDKGEISGKTELKDFNTVQSVEKPSDYSIESELLE